MSKSELEKLERADNLWQRVLNHFYRNPTKKNFERVDKAGQIADARFRRACNELVHKAHTSIGVSTNGSDQDHRDHQ